MYFSLFNCKRKKKLKLKSMPNTNLKHYFRIIAKQPLPYIISYMHFKILIWLLRFAVARQYIHIIQYVCIQPTCRDYDQVRKEISACTRKSNIIIFVDIPLERSPKSQYSATSAVSASTIYLFIYSAD